MPRRQSDFWWGFRVTFIERYYRDFAQIDTDQMRKEWVYSYPAAVTRAYLNHREQGDLPVTDIGCDTDLVASAL